MRTLIALLLCLSVQGQTASPAAGDWTGTLETPMGGLKLALHVTVESGQLRGKLDSLSQGAMGIPIDEISFQDPVLRFSIRRLGASYEGTITKDGNIIEGKFQQGGAALPLKLVRGSVTALLRPQEPKPPFPYQVEEAVIENKKAGIRLAGALTLPSGAGPFPAAVLISGSGPQDRDEQIMGHKPFAVLADALTRRGIAVLRYDDRGFGKSGGLHLSATTADFAEDAAAAMDFLKSKPAIRGDGIGLIGHSEGGLVAPMVAAKRGDVAFVVLLAGQGVTGEQVMLAQAPAVMKAMGLPAQAIEANAQLQRQIFAALREENDPLAQSKRLSSLMPPGAAADAQIRHLTGPWMSFYRTYDPVPALRQTKCPVLALIGSLDTQVLPEQNLPVIEAALKTGGNKDFRVEQLPGLNHLFQTAKTGAPSEYGQIEETMAPSVLQLIGDWLAARVGPRK